MSITLEDLRADFDELCRKLSEEIKAKEIKADAYHVVASRVTYVDIDFYAKNWIGFVARSLSCPDNLTQIRADMYRAAKIYCIARDEGLEAAMIWKLQQP